MEITVHRRTSNDIETGGGADGNGETLLITQALERDKREGLRLTIQARFLILAVLALLILTRIP